MAKIKGKINFKYNLKVYLTFLKEYKLPIFFLLFLILILEISYVIDKLIFKELIDKGTLFTLGSLPKNVFITLLLGLAFGFAFTLLIRVIATWFQVHLISHIESNLMTNLKRKFFNHILHLSNDFHTSNKTGSLISKIIRGSSAIERLTDLFVFNVIPFLFQLIAVVLSLAYFNASSVIVILIIVLLFVIYSVIINTLQQKANIDANNAEDFEKANISDVLTNIDSIKYFGKEEFIKRRFKKISTLTKEAIVYSWNFGTWRDAGQTTILGIGVFFLMYFPLKSFIAGTITLGTLTFIYGVYGNLISPLFGLVHGIRDFYRTMADFEALFAYGKIENDIKDLPNAQPLILKQGNIEFRNISFSYKNRKILENIHLLVPEHKKVALVGPSGAGKSTLIKLLYRLYDVQEGEIFIDGKNIKEFKQESLRSELSIVPQECVLFDDTIYNNVLFSKPDATKEEVLKAMKFAQLDKVITTFPNKEYTIVGERGVKLSGGEKQRVSIARAILANKKVLILDEATSSLDSETEHEIQKDLEKLMQGRTSIIIAHRLSTIMKADFIVVLNAGKIVQVDTHQKLIRQDGLYKKLWQLQKGGYLE